MTMGYSTHSKSGYKSQGKPADINAQRAQSLPVLIAPGVAGVGWEGGPGSLRVKVFSFHSGEILSSHCNVNNHFCSHSPFSRNRSWNATASPIGPREAEWLQTQGVCKTFDKGHFMTHSNLDVPDNSCWPRCQPTRGLETALLHTTGID